ncbi:MAG TPA: hypothetical protein ENN49_03190 [Bacteroidales bacterium]|nr:hypothetical protein [Bacteroidales bacterium]
MIIKSFRYFTSFTTSILILSTISLNAQYYYTGVEAYKTNWKKKEYGNIRLFFPAEADSLANLYLWTLLKSDSLNDNDYHLGQKQIDVVLHPNSILSNGFVAWAPRRMELVTQPYVYGDALLWHKTLSIHEIRHVKQMYALNSGTVRVFSWLFGQQAVGLASSFVHPWVYEGDAVWAETNYTYAGRGRSAPFFNHYYTHSVSGQKSYSYDKWLLGSYKDYIPNHYQFGYQLVNYINRQWGTQTIPSTYRYVGRYPFFFSTYFGLKKATGLSRKNIYLKAFAHNDSLWCAEFIMQGLAQLELNSNEDFKNLVYPYQLNDSTSIAYISSLANTPFFGFVKKNGKMKKIVSPGLLIGPPSYNDSLILWAEYNPHSRWEWMSNSSIKVYNFKSQKLKNVVSGRYHSPVFDSNRIICIEYSSNGTYSLVSLNMHGKKTTLLTFSGGFEVQQICKDAQTNTIYGIAVTESGKKIFRVDSTFSFSIVYNAAYRDIRMLACAGSNLFFSFTDGFTENVYHFDIKQNILFNVMSNAPNSSYPSIKNGNLIFSYYTPKGYRINTIKNVLSNRKKVDNMFPYNEIVEAKERNIHDTAPPIYVQSTDYKGIKTMVNIHSWFPYYMKPLTDPADIQDESSVYPGITLLSQNLTGTTLFNTGYGYDGGAHLFFASLTYRGFWPVFNLNLEQTNTSAALYQVTQTYPENRDYFKKAELTTLLPFTLSGGLYRSSFQIYNIFSLNNNYIYNESIDAYRSGLYLNEFGFAYYSLRRMSHRDLQPKYGMFINTGILTTPWDYNNFGNLWYAKAKFYLPGLMENQGISLTLTSQNQNIKYIYLNNKIDFPTAYFSYPSSKFFGIYFDYIMPLKYPDFSVGSLVYIKRIAVNLFTDFAKNTFKTNQNFSMVTLTDNLQSVGFDAIVDLHFFRTWYPFRLKFTQAFIGNDYRAYSNISLSINLYSTFAGQNL